MLWILGYANNALFTPRYARGGGAAHEIDRCRPMRGRYAATVATLRTD